MTARPRIWLRAIGFARGPLRRKSDRGEAALVIATALLTAAAVPVGLGVNDAAFAYSTRISAERAAQGQYVDALLTADVPAGVSSGENSDVGRPQVPATWFAPDGTARSGAIRADPGGKAGERVPVWTDRSGRPAAAPVQPGEMRAQAAVIAVIVALLWLLVVAAVQWAGAAVLLRLRLASWDREWARVGPKWRSVR